MRIRILCITLGLAVVGGTGIAARGGNGPLVVTQWKGSVQIRALDNDCSYRTRFGSPLRPVSTRWQPVRKGDYLGEFELRTSRGSWVHLNTKFVCVDRDSLVTIDSAADISLTVRKGSLSAVDGKKGPALYKAGDHVYW